MTEVIGQSIFAADFRKNVLYECNLETKTTTENDCVYNEEIQLIKKISNFQLFCRDMEQTYLVKVVEGKLEFTKVI